MKEFKKTNLIKYEFLSFVAPIHFPDLYIIQCNYKYAVQKLRI